MFASQGSSKYVVEFNNPYKLVAHIIGKKPDVGKKNNTEDEINFDDEMETIIKIPKRGEHCIGDNLANVNSITVW